MVKDAKKERELATCNSRTLNVINAFRAKKCDATRCLLCRVQLNGYLILNAVKNVDKGKGRGGCCHIC